MSRNNMTEHNMNTASETAKRARKISKSLVKKAGICKTRIKIPDTYLSKCGAGCVVLFKIEVK